MNVLNMKLKLSLNDRINILSRLKLRTDKNSILSKIRYTDLSKLEFLNKEYINFNQSKKLR